MGKEKEKCDINDSIEIHFNGMNLAQMVFVQAVLVPELLHVIDSYADALTELGD